MMQNESLNTESQVCGSSGTQLHCDSCNKKTSHIPSGGYWKCDSCGGDKSLKEKVKEMMPGTAEYHAKKVDEGKFGKDKDGQFLKGVHEPKATDGFTCGEKIKSIFPGTAEHRAKKAAEERLDGQLPHSIIKEVGLPKDSTKIE